MCLQSAHFYMYDWHSFNSNHDICIYYMWDTVQEAVQISLVGWSANPLPLASSFTIHQTHTSIIDILELNILGKDMICQIYHPVFLHYVLRCKAVCSTALISTQSFLSVHPLMQSYTRVCIDLLWVKHFFMEYKTDMFPIPT